MQLAKPRLDIGLSTNDIGPMLAFWQGEAGIPFDHLLPIRRGQDQHRHDVLGSVLKINHHAAPLPAAAPSGYLELMIAREGLSEVRALADPEGNRVSLVPPGHEGVTQIGVRLGVRDLDAHRRFYGEALGLPEERPGAFRAGESLILLEADPEAPADAGMQGTGWRYITFQVFKVDDEHAAVLAKGGREALAPVTLGTTARISMVRDPDGNWIELSQRASIVGSLA
ncbi:MAG: VOC family protein [Phenylobacterium sp.]|uniref:VOC family protein n=1 Tax=Phenylobacterium sp. TaxID=1871053 RepID=UPI001A5DD08C|nr:VOC family protein [Phenylobacterium sp.]MBL8554734.1 VOC family protein [Phenylobacterium sp.]